MDFRIVWFALWGVLWTVYFVADGFDLGAGMLHPFVARGEGERRAVIGSIGPFWDGNEVWLVTAGGATFAAFPAVYASMFSSLYTALLLLLFALITRGVSIELRGKAEGAAWRRWMDRALAAGSFLPPLLLGVAFGNIFAGLPIDEAGFHGGLPALLNPYGLVTGALFVLLFLFHGGLWLALKTSGPLSERCAAAARALWPALAAAVAVFLAYTAFATRLYDNFLGAPALLAVPLAGAAALVAARVWLGRGRALAAFLASCLLIAAVSATGFIGLFPDLLPSRLGAQHSLTVYNASSSPYTLKIMTAVALVFVPVVIAYQLWSYRVFRRPIDPDAALREELY